MKKLITIVSIMAVIFGVYALYTVSNAADETWTDFSNAKYEIKYGLSTSGNDEIIVSGIDGGFNGYYVITSNNAKPEFNENNITYSKASKAEQSGTLSLEASKELELNQDLYLWIIEEKTVAGNNSYKFVVEGEKIEKAKYPSDYKLFSSFTFLSDEETQISLENIAWAEHTRNMSLKIGKITDVNLLNNIKNNATKGFAELLTYAKNSTAIFEKNLSSTKTTSGEFDRGYSSSSGHTGDNLNLSCNNLENKSYVFIYTLLDDESGKYIPVEGVTIAQVINPFGREGMIYVYGSNEFQWSEFGNGDTESISNTGTTTPKTDPDETVATTILPKTGINLTVVLAILGMSVVAIVSYNKYKTWKEIK